MSKNKTGLKPVNPREDFVAMEEKLLDNWYSTGMVDKYLNRNKGADKNFSFIDGPITANNPMGVHHAMSRTYKDVVQRYKNMQGFEQRFQNGFDCQGLWVEVNVEKELGFNSKMDIMDYGLDKFTDSCVSRVNKFAGVQTEQSKRLGMFMDWDNSYYTMSEENNLYIWKFLKLAYEKELLYKGKSATTWCPRCETGLSQHEQLDGYQDITDLSVYFTAKLTDADNEYILVWTTTPWTISSNYLLAVNPDLQYVKASKDCNYYYMVKEAAERLGFEDYTDADVSDMVGRHYESIYNDIPAQEGVEHYVVEWNLIDAASGTGVVHIAPNCGQEDFELGQELGLKAGTVLDDTPLDTAGVFKEGYGDLTGKNAHDVAQEVADYLKEKGSLFKTEEYNHSYPHCWRCTTKCLFRLEDNWYLNVQKLKKEMEEQVEEAEWVPDAARKRMHDWLFNMGDWMISRKRYYGLSLPFYECDKCGKLHVVGSKEELKEHAVKPELVDELPSLHRPWTDDIKIKCTECSNEVTRIVDVGDCWLDAGVVPFSTLKYFEDKDYWDKWFPADYITEMVEQVRLWFYSMLVFGVLVEGKIPYKFVLAFNELRDEKNEKLSKSKPNYVNFDDAADKVGTDVLRWNYVTSSVAMPIKFGWPIFEEVRRRFYLVLWNSYSYFVTYANQHGWEYAGFKPEDATNIMDKWVLSKLAELSRFVEEKMDKYDMASSSREIEEFVKELSQWYIRRSRGRFRDGDVQALNTLHYVLVELSKILAPFMPFVSDEIYQNLVVSVGVEGAKESVHLEDFNHHDESSVDSKVLTQMEAVRNVATVGLSLRDVNRLKLRQPLAKVEVKGLKLEDEYVALLGEELNVKEVVMVDDLTKEDGWVVSEEGHTHVSLDTNLTDELAAEGLYREVTRAIQNARKKFGLKAGEVVAMDMYTTADDVKKLVEDSTDAFMTDLSVSKVDMKDSELGDDSVTAKVNDTQVQVAFSK